LLESTGGGCVWFDYDNDGLIDLYVISGKPLESGMHPYPLKKPPVVAPHNHLYRNRGNGTFTDVTDEAGVGTNMFGIAAVAADFDNDGFVDLFVTGYGHATLFRNRGNGTFEDVTIKAGIKVDGWPISSAWLDYDRDGCVDLFIGRYVKFDPQYRAYYAADNYPGPLDYEPDTNRLYHNNCNGTFSDVTDKSGIGALKGRAMGVTAADFDGDGYPDIYVANDKTESFLFRNSRDGTFQEIAADLGVAYGQNGEMSSAMGPVFADLEGRGRMDLWVTDSKYNRLLRNAGKAGFEDISESAGISVASAQYASWGPGAAGTLAFPRAGEREVFRCLARRRAGIRREDSGPWRLLCRLRQRRQGGCVRGQPGRAGGVAAQRDAE
jgi:enediyne biosynthesis protein E4